jgi:septum formation protein
LTRFALLINLNEMQIVLASQSPYRKLQLQNFGLHFEAHAPAVNEDELKAKGPADLTELTRYLAHEKAQSLRSRFPKALILGGDQLVDFAGRRLDKPGQPERAFEQLRQLAGQTHRLITSLVALAPTGSHTHTDITTVELRKLSDAEIRAYLAQDEPWDCAGSYKIERAGLALVERLQTQDPSAIQGVPVLGLCQALRHFGVPWSDIWGKT